MLPGRAGIFSFIFFMKAGSISPLIRSTQPVFAESPINTEAVKYESLASVFLLFPFPPAALMGLSI